MCQQTFWDCPLSLHCQSHKMVANRRHRFHGGQWRLEMPMNCWRLIKRLILYGRSFSDYVFSTSHKSVLFPAVKESFILIFDSQLNLGFVRIQKYIFIFTNYSQNAMLAIIPGFILLCSVLISVHLCVCPQLKEKCLLVSPSKSQSLSKLAVWLY